MKNRSSLSKSLATTVLASAIFAPSVFAKWVVQDDASEVSYLSTKVFAGSSGSVTESNTISGVTGSISKNGLAIFNIDLTTLQTNIDIRNKRVKQFVFDIAQFGSTATIEAKIKPEYLNQEEQIITLPATLKLAGQSKEVVLTLHTSTHGDIMKVVSAKPAIVNGSAFGLNAGFSKLTELAGLGYIPMDIPVSFTLTLERKTD